MRDHPDDPLNDPLEENTPTTGATRPVASSRQSTQPTQRPRLPVDDLPMASSRPALPRADRPSVQPAPQRISTEPTRVSRRNRTKARPARAPIDKSRSGLYLPWWSLVLMLAFVGCAALGALLVVGSIQNTTDPAAQTPLVIVITSTFTVGAPASQTPIPLQATLTPSPLLPTIPPSVTLPPGNFAIGATIQVVGVGPSGLNVRTAPGTGSSVKFLAQDGDFYFLKDGPQTASNDEWWYIQDSVDSNKGGWASRRFLTIPVPTALPQVGTAAH